MGPGRGEDDLSEERGEEAGDVGVDGCGGDGDGRENISETLGE